MSEIKNADEATEKALSFLMEKYPLRGKVARPIKTNRENNHWLVEFNVGIVRVLTATIKIDAFSSDVIEYDIPPLSENAATG